MEIIHNAPTIESFIPFSTYQSQTPDSFFSCPPVLYHHSPSATLKTQASELVSAPAFRSLFANSEAATNGTAVVNGVDADIEEDHEVEAQDVDVWVTSEYGGLSIIHIANHVDGAIQTLHPLLPLQSNRPLNPLPFHLPPRHPALHPNIPTFALPPAPNPAVDI